MHRTVSKNPFKSQKSIFSEETFPIPSSFRSKITYIYDLEIYFQGGGGLLVNFLLSFTSSNLNTMALQTLVSSEKNANHATGSHNIVIVINSKVLSTACLPSAVSNGYTILRLL